MKDIIISANTSWYIYNFKKDFIQALAGEGFKIFIFAPRDPYSDRLAEISDGFVEIPIDSKSLNPLKDLRVLWYYYKNFRKLRNTFVLNYTPKSNIYSTIAASFCSGVKTISNISGLGLGFSEDTILTKLLLKMYQFSQRNAHAVFFQNPDDMDFFLSENIVTKNQAHLVPGSGVNLARFVFSPLPDSSQITFLFVARMLFSKGVGILIEAIKYLKNRGYHNFTVKLLGEVGVNSHDAVPLSMIEEWVEEGYCEYLGKTDFVEQYYVQSHCVILPTYYREGIPRSLIEGLASGRIVITTNSIGSKETVIDGWNGFLVTPRDSYDLTLKMEKILNMDRAELIELSSNSRKLAESKFDEMIVVRSYLNLLCQ